MQIIKNIFALYIFILLNLKLIDCELAIKFFYYFYKMNYNLLDDVQFYLNLINNAISDENRDIQKLKKYTTCIFIISKINSDAENIIKTLNRTKLYKLQKRIIDVKKTNNSHSQDIDLNLDITNIINFEKTIRTELEILKNYISSYDNKKNSIAMTGIYAIPEKAQNIYKKELIERYNLLRNMISDKLILLFVNKKSRKSRFELELYNTEYLESLKYIDIVHYITFLFDQLNKNIDKYINDIEFNKNLQIIVNAFLKDQDDQITKKFHSRILKKYII
jgi:hypothetical protein